MRLILCILWISIGFSQTEPLLEEAKKAADELNDLKALHFYQKVLETEANQIDALIGVSHCLTNIGNLKEDEDRRLNDFREAVVYAEKAVAFAPHSDKAHFQLAVALGRVSQNVGSKERLQLSKRIKKEADKTIELNAEHDGALHVLGKWHFGISDLNWAAKTIANAVLGGVPKEASFENAKTAFEKAIAIAPNKISHRVELGRTLIELDKEEEARQVLTTALELPETFSGDKKLKTEAKKLIGNL